jgi:adiponectin receptor
MFVLMGLSAIAPIVHGLQLYGLDQMRNTVALDFVVTQGLLYIIGAYLYAARFPERISPGTFDIWGSSHQIFHVLVVLAATTHLIGMVKAFDYEHSQRNGAVSLTFLHKVWPQ